MPQVCPSCNLTNPDTAIRCDCGLDLSSNIASAQKRRHAAQSMHWTMFLGSLVILSVMISVVCYFQFRSQLEGRSITEALWLLSMVGAGQVLAGLSAGGLVGLALWAVSQRSPHILRTMFIVTAVATIVIFVGQSKRSSFTPAIDIESGKDDGDAKDFAVLDKLTSMEKVRFQEIIGLTMKDPGYMTPQVHAEFWTILTKVAPRADDIRPLREFLVDISKQLQRYFWEDALLTIRMERPYKSVQREQLEKKLLNASLIPEWRIQQNQRLIEQMAMHAPIQIGAEEVLVTEELIKTILGNIDAGAKRIDLLFTPPATKAG